MRHLVVRVMQADYQWSLYSELPERLVELFETYVEKRDSGQSGLLYLNTRFYKCDVSHVMTVVPYATSSGTDDLQVILWGQVQVFENRFRCACAIRSISSILADLEGLPDDVRSRITNV